MKQSSKAGTIKTTNPQSVQPITAVDQITEDASSWNTVNGAKQSRGFAYCDGSTLTNVGGIYDDFVAAHGSLVLPNGPFKTRQLGFTLGSPTTSNPIQITSPTETGMVLSDDLLFAHSDTEGNWFLTFALRLTFNARNDNNWDFTFSDIDVITTPVSSVVNSFVATQASISATSQLLRIYSSSSFSNDTIRVSGTVPLNSKPTWADANLESYPVIALQNNVAANALGLPEASASQSGTVTLDQVAEAGRNYIINGAFDIWQRGVGPFTNNYYDSDRWLSSSVGSSHSTNQESFTLGQSAVEGSPKFFYSNTVTTGSLSSHFTVSQQRIEGVDSLNNQTAVLSFYAKADSTKDISIEFVQNFGTGGSPSTEVDSIGVNKITLSDSWQKFSVEVNIPSVAGKTVGTDNNSYLGVRIWLEAGSDFDARTDSLGTQSGTFDISQVKLEEGTQATKFTRAGGTLGGELALCQRYGFTPNPPGIGSSTQNIGMGYAISANEAFITVSSPVTMRVFPSFSYSGTFRISNHVGGSASANVTSISILSGSYNSFILDVTKGAGTNLTAGSALTFLRYFDGSATIFFDAEL